MSSLINWFQEHPQIIFWVSICVVIGLIVSVSVLFSLYSNLSDLNKGLLDNESSIKELQGYQAGNDAQGPRGPAGLRGPPGPKGGAGGDFQASGPLRNLQSSGAYVMDRLHGSGVASVAYLNKLNYQPNQIWTYSGNNQILNKYGQCLEGDSISGNAYMAGCDPNSSKQKWTHNNYGQLSSVEGGECLDVTLESQFDGANKIEQGSKLQSGNSHYNLRQVKLKKCDPANNINSSQQWVFA